MSIQGTTLNPADVATGAGTTPPTITNGNLTIAGQLFISGWMAARAVDGASSGQFQFNVTIGNLAHAGPNDGCVAGILLAAASINAFAVQGANFPGGLVWQQTGQVTLNGTLSVATWPTWGTGDKLTFAVNMDTQQIWGQKNSGAWNGSLSASPRLGIGGVSFAALGAGAVKPVAWINNNGLTANQMIYDFSLPDQLPANPTTMLVWARGIKQIENTGLYGPGNWTNVYAGTLPGGPEQGTGGVNMGGAALAPNNGAKVYITAQGTGDAGIRIATGVPFFKTKPPQGFAWGWPNGFGGPNGKFDPATAQGSAVVDATGWGVSFPATSGLVQSTVGVSQGSYYIEYEIFTDIFSQGMGVGFGRHNPNLASWGTGGGFAPGDDNGGAFINGGNIGNGYQATLGANTAPGINIPDFATPPGTSIGVALTITNDFALGFQPQPLMPVPLVCVPCTELILPNQSFRNRFGR
jgi:hypothetical protein